MPRFCLSVHDHDHDGDDNDDDFDSSEVDDENEPPHPIGFSPGRARYALDDKDYDSDTDDDDNDDIDDSNNLLQLGSLAEQRFPPISSCGHYVNTMTSPMKALVRHALESNSQQQQGRRQRRLDHDDDQGHNDIDILTRALRDGTMFESPTPAARLSISSSSSATRSLMAATAATATISTAISLQLPTAYASLVREEARIEKDMISTQQYYEREHAESARHVQALLDANQRQADIQEARWKKQQQELEDEQAAELQAQEDMLAAQRQEEQRQRDAVQEQKTKQRQVQQAEQEALRAAEAKKKAATEYMTRAEKLMAQLKQLRASVEPFETSKPMGKRRLNMKKVINGRVNTLSEDVGKIRDVARDVSQAIATSRQEDAHYKTQLEAAAAVPGQPSEYTAEMARGKRYFLDLLSSKVVVRVQAEGFNGQRGDGFPLAAMLAAIAVDNKDLVPVLTAHIFTVCPTAIPKLPTPSPDATEEELMESLGMIKGKNGEFETFERFLSRTEGLISIVADIMSSEPSDHTLFGGHEGAVKWLARFLSQLPPAPQSPLPLFTAPVLDAFLTGAGHMLANKHPEDFKKYLAFIIDDCLPRIDEGTIGKPSATRLRKTVQGNFDGFRNKLPGRALAELYYGANSSSSGGSSTAVSSNPFSTNRAPIGSGVSVPSPFGGPPSTSTAAPNPFGGGSTTTPAASPFGVTASAPNTTAFGSSSSQNQPFGGGQQPSNSNPFGGGSTTTTAASPFGLTSSAPATGFGSSSSQNQPFGGGQQSSSSNPFGGGSAAAAAASPFGLPSSAPAAPFGASSSQNQPFGGGQQPSNSNPFGGGSTTTSTASPFGVNTPFGGGQQTSTPFGGTTAPAPIPSPFGPGLQISPSPFGNTAPPAPTPFGTTSTASPFGSNAPVVASPFGGGAGASSASSFGFGTSGQSQFGAPISSSFGNNNAPAPSPFGGGGGFGAAAPVASPFGAPAPAPAPFGSFGASAPSPSPYGTAAPSPSPYGSFGSGNGQFGGGGSGNNTKAPCKFFAQGHCRYGSNCRFSHDNAAGGGGGGPFNSAPSPFSNFGGPRR